MTNLATSAQMITGTAYDAANRTFQISGMLSESRTCNVMGQMTQLTPPGSSGLDLNISYNYSATQNHGKITSQTDNLTGEQIVYAYDGFGNLTNQTVTAGTAPSLSVTYNASTNLQTTDCADANGNILVSGATYNCNNIPFGSAYGYDVANRLYPPIQRGGAGTFYSYAPGNKRVWRGAIDINQNITLDEVTFWSVTGQKLATYNLYAGSPQYVGNKTYVPTLGQTLGVANVYFGSKLLENVNGNVVSDRLGSVGKYYPWGQEKPSATTNGTEKFTGYFRDAETGLDYAKNRYHQPGMGRFMSPDPYQQSAGPDLPGSWNRYAYVVGDPVNFTDSTGLYLDCTDGAGDCEESDGGDQANDGGGGGGGGGGNFSNSDITGYDEDGNPIIGDRNQTNSNSTVNVTSAGWLLTLIGNINSILTNNSLVPNVSVVAPIPGSGAAKIPFAGSSRGHHLHPFDGSGVHLSGIGIQPYGRGRGRWHTFWGPEECRAQYCPRILIRRHHTAVSYPRDFTHREHRATLNLRAIGRQQRH